MDLWIPATLSLMSRKGDVWTAWQICTILVLPVWPDLAKFCHFGKGLQVFGKKWRFISDLAKWWTYFGKICDIIGLIFSVANGQILKNNRTIWSHCLWFDVVRYKLTKMTRYIILQHFHCYKLKEKCFITHSTGFLLLMFSWRWNGINFYHFETKLEEMSKHSRHAKYERERALVCRPKYVPHFQDKKFKLPDRSIQFPKSKKPLLST